MKHIAISIFLSSLLLVSWLFYDTSQPSSLVDSTTNIDNTLEFQELSASVDRQQKQLQDLINTIKLNTKKVELTNKLPVASDAKYTIFVQEDGLNRVFLLNTETGESWRYYINQGKSEGWLFMNFNASGVEFSAAEEGKAFTDKVLKRSR